MSDLVAIVITMTTASLAHKIESRSALRLVREARKARLADEPREA